MKTVIKKLDRSPPGFVIAGTHSGVGKTSITVGFMRLLTRRGVRVQPFKVGPDYIDPGHHTRACEQPAYNLDSFMSSRKYVQRLFHDVAQKSDVGVVEGVMGLFDGAFSKKEKGSTAEIAKLLNLPVILIFNGEAIARSAAALVKGFLEFDPDVKFLGVIANRVTHPKHAELLKQAIERYTRARFLGHLPSSPELSIPSRHLGLFQSHENQSTLYDQWADHLEKHLDIDAILRKARVPQKIPSRKKAPTVFRWPRRPSSFSFKVAIARDDAFQFYYQDTLDCLAHNGGEIHYFSPLRDKKLPDGTDWIYLPGGYPELFAKKLSSNQKMLQVIRTFGETGKVIVGECGGLMYLGQSITDEKNKVFPMAGLFDFSTSIQNKKLTLGYRKLAYRPNDDSKKNLVLTGHEFHSSSFTENEEAPQMTQKSKENSRSVKDGYRVKNSFALYSHIYWSSSPGWMNYILNTVQRTQ